MQPSHYLPLGFGSLPLLAQAVQAPDTITGAAFWIAILGALATVIRAITEPVSLRRQLKDAREHNVTCERRVDVLEAALMKALGESPRDYIARKEDT